MPGANCLNPHAHAAQCGAVYQSYDNFEARDFLALTVE